MANAKKRLDVALVDQGFFESVDQAARNVMAGLVYFNGLPASKPGMPVGKDDLLSLAPKEKFVGRGGYKIEAGLHEFGINPAGLVCLDVGASTGGFTDCLLQKGARFVYAIDVGHDQMDWRIKKDPRVSSREGVNARFLKAEDFSPSPELAVGDVSFISLTLILPAVFRVLALDSAAVFLIKPQFELPRNEVGSGGVVKDESARMRAVEKIQTFVEQAGHRWIGYKESPITGREGNVEYLCHIKK